MAQATMLTRNDNAVLGALFDPEASLSNTINIDSSESIARKEDVDEESRELERDVVLKLNQENLSEVEVRRAIQDLDCVIEQWPRYASAYNNRAQARRMLFNLRLDNIMDQTSVLKAIMDDLSESIALVMPGNPTASISASDARVLSSAYTHRGHLLWSASRHLDLTKALQAGVQNLQHVDAEGLEEMASHDFALGGRYGNSTAKQLAVKLNPFAKLCGSIVKQAMQKEISDYYLVPKSTAGSETSRI